MTTLLLWLLPVLSLAAPLLLGAIVSLFFKRGSFFRRWGLSTVISLIIWGLGIFLLWKLAESSDLSPDPEDIQPHNTRSLVSGYGVWVAPLVPLGTLIICWVQSRRSQRPS